MTERTEQQIRIAIKRIIANDANIGYVVKTYTHSVQEASRVTDDQIAELSVWLSQYLMGAFLSSTKATLGRDLNLNRVEKVAKEVARDQLKAARGNRGVTRTFEFHESRNTVHQH